MIIELDEYQPGQDLSCDLCIAGGGAAGLAIALEFLDRPPSVLVLEGGGLAYSDDSQEIYQGEVVGHPYFELDQARLRYLGGSTNHWGGWCRPLEPLAFAARPWVPHSGWPIGPEALEPYLDRAHAFLHMGKPRYRREAAATVIPVALPELDAGLLVDRFWNEGEPLPQVGEIHHDTLRRAMNVTVILDASVRDLLLSESTEHVLALEVQQRDGARRKVTARHFVLALGGLENPRLLLDANRQMATGVGNRQDLVGRFFMEHIEYRVGRLAASDPRWLSAAYDPILVPDERYFLRAGIGLDPAVQRTERVLDHTFSILARRTRNASSGYVALRKTMRQARAGRFAGLADRLPEILGDLGGAVGGAYEVLSGQYELAGLVVHSHGEQAPNPASRVRLTDQVDRLGLRRIALDWRLTRLDKRSSRFAAELLARELGRLGLGRLELPEWLLDDGDDWGDMEGARHHMGTTRMADDPRRGVVDPECRVFGLDNLHIAGSSVFPAGGSANPTLAIVQLAQRLADRLATLM